MDSDPISESTPKRRKIGHFVNTQNLGYDSQDDSGDELFRDLDHTEQNTVPTQPLPVSQRRPNKPIETPYSSLMATLTGQTSQYPTQRYSSPSQPIRSSPDVEVPASSPPAKVIEPSRKRPLSSIMAPPGTAFRKPLGVQSKPQKEIISLDSDDNAPADLSDDEPMPGEIKPTSFTRGGRDGTSKVDNSPAQESAAKFKSLTSQFAYGTSTSRSDDMAGAYGGQHRRNKPQRQNGPSKALPVDDISIEDITDPTIRDRVERMQKVFGSTKTIRKLKHAAHMRKSVEDAMNYVVEQEEREENEQAWHDLPLESSDIENNAAKKLARPIAKAKQEIKAPNRTIGEKYSTQAKQAVKAPTRSIGEKYAPRPVVDKPVPVEVDKPRRKLVRGRKHASSPVREPTPEPEPEAVSIPSDDDDTEAENQDEEESVQEGSLLQWINDCGVQEFADLANEKEDIASFILSHRPFKTLNEIRVISNVKPTKSGKKSTRKPIGEKVLDVCEEMWDGYEAVDALVKKCDDIGEPIRQTMNQWGLDMTAATQDGELGITKIEDPHDSGIGTPSSTMSVDDDVVSPVKRSSKKALKQPAIMSKNLKMKDYQVFGLNWLNLLWTKRLSCILADDMGLGKTCQVISFLAHLKETEVEGVHLVVVPGSTLENWLREFGRFCPDLSVTPYYGTQAEREEQRVNIMDDIDNIDVIVTTYETASNDKGDNQFLRKEVRPTVCVFDEGHALKNSTSKRHRQLMRIPAKFRLLLTGTPLQNNLQELVSLLSFILPKVFEEMSGSLESIFRYKATTTDSDHAALLSKQRIQRARSMMTPFILRRKKQQVLKDIPAKHRRVEYCDMVPVQRELWNKRVEEARRLRDEPRKGKKTSVHMMSLRQAALHPLLTREIYTEDKLRQLEKILLTDSRSEFVGNPPALMWKYLTEDLKGGDFALHRFCEEHSDFIPAKFTLSHEEWMQSGKVQTLKRILAEYIKNGDRILLFSQFTTMLDILEAVMEKLGIKFMRLDGSTDMSTRQDIIDQYTNDETIPLFMLSTKAGGAGINLACANKVVIFDSSFNPQDDIQAENRAHRVGQTREVEVVRLVTRGTIEEQIHALGESKLALDDRVAGADVGEAAAEKAGEKAVEQAFLDALQSAPSTDAMEVDPKEDVGEQFKKGLKGAGLNIAD
ncbi:hypothetical protein MBLNU457_7819t1 [Dothideomycetes sp. NU457]